MTAGKGELSLALACQGDKWKENTIIGKEVLLHEFPTVNELRREWRVLSSATALRLSRLFGNSSEFWLNLQRAVDLWNAMQLVGKDIRRIKVLDPA